MAQYHCNYCQEDIQGLRVKCAECVDFDLCLQCFSCGAEIGCHRNGHSYQIIDCGTFPIFNAPNSWKALEELRLLDAVEQYGFGNWDDVAEHVRTKSSEESSEHYCNMFIMGTIGRLTWPKDVTFRPKDQTIPDGGPLSPSLSIQYQPLELTQQEQQELGYMPHRDDFEREFDNDAESLVSNLTITQDDEEIDIALKLAHVDMFSRRLRERLRKKKIVRDYALVPQFYNVNNKNKGPGTKKKHSKEDKELHEKMRVVAQFHPFHEHEQLFENMQRERELKLRIKELVRFRRNGLTRLDESSEFETAKYKRDRKKENKKKSVGILIGSFCCLVY